MNHWDDRPGKDHTVGAVVKRLNAKLYDGGRVFVVEPPSIPGYGTGGGFEFQLLDQSSGVYSLNEFFGSARSFSNSDSVLNQVYTLKRSMWTGSRWLRSVSISPRCLFSANFGGQKVRRVYVQADEVSRATPQRLLYVANAKGEQIPLSEFMSARSRSTAPQKKATAPVRRSGR